MCSHSIIIKQLRGIKMNWSTDTKHWSTVSREDRNSLRVFPLSQSAWPNEKVVFLQSSCSFPVGFLAFSFHILSYSAKLRKISVMCGLSQTPCGWRTKRKHLQCLYIQASLLVILSFNTFSPCSHFLMCYGLNVCVPGNSREQPKWWC